jgi:hypothetical protein
MDGHEYTSARRAGQPDIPGLYKIIAQKVFTS